MGDITGARNNIKEEEVAYKRPVSESTWYKIGGAINFINDYQYDSKAFNLNGFYGLATTPFLGPDGLFVCPFNITIFAAAMFVITAGSGGTTELDVKRATSSGGAFSSIFSTTPKIASTAGSMSYIKTGGSGSGLTAPVLTGTTFNCNAGDALRLDLISAQTGTPESCGLVLFHRPR